VNVTGKAATGIVRLNITGLTRGIDPEEQVGQEGVKASELESGTLEDQGHIGWGPERGTGPKPYPVTEVRGKGGNGVPLLVVNKGSSNSQAKENCMRSLKIAY